MAHTSGVLEALKKSSKGKIQYNRFWQEGEDVAVLQLIPISRNTQHQMLYECNSPPQLTSHPDTLQRKRTHNNRTRSADVVVEEIPPLPPPQLEMSVRAIAAEKMLRDADTQMSYKAKAEFENHRRRFTRHQEQMTQETESKLIQLYFQLDSQAETSMKKCIEQEQAGEHEIKRKQIRLKESHQQRKREQDEKMKEAQRKHKEKEDLKQKIHEESIARLRLMVTHLSNVKAIHAKCEELLQSCTDPQHLCDATKRSPQLIIQVYERIKREINQSQHAERVEDDNVMLVTSAADQATKIYALLHAQITEANKKGKEAADKEEKAKQEIKQKQEAEEKKKKDQETAAKAQAAAATAAAQNATVKAGDVQCITPEALSMYEDVMKTSQQAQEEFKVLQTDANLKKAKFALQKAVNTPVNAISATSMDHLRDKIQRLSSVLSGQQSVDAGPSAGTLNVGSIPGGQAFCKDLFARKIVKQGEEQVSSAHESAFPVAYVTVNVMRTSPDVTKLILAHFYTKCPYLVPYYRPKKEGQTSEEYYKSLGYLYEDDQVEKQDKFLRRMSGLMRLYAAIIVTPCSSSPHPHGIDRGWCWLVSVLSLEPRPFITATLLYDLLEVAGHALIKAYGRQFIKLIKVLIAVYMPRIKAASPAGAGGPLVRLETFLAKVVSTGSIAPPQGMLTGGRLW